MRYNVQRRSKRMRSGFLWLPKTMWMSFFTKTRETRWLENATWFEDNDGYGWLQMYWHNDALERYFRAFGDLSG